MTDQPVSTPIDAVGGWKPLLSGLVAGRDLSDEQARAALETVLAGCASPVQITALLVGLAAKGPVPSEVTAMVDVMLAHAAALDLPDPAATVDIVGTGGSRLRQDRAFNISTAACFVVAGAGVPVCKHGNRRASSSSGSTDAVEALGIQVELDGPAVARCVQEAGVGFAFARRFHPAMRHVGPVRADLGLPTVFNLLGPLSHPGGVQRQVIGVADPSTAPLVIDVLRRRNAPRAMVVHGADGLDELSLAGPSTIWELRDGVVTEQTVHPADVGLLVVSSEQLGVGAPADNAAVIQEVLDGNGGPREDLVVLNAAAGLVVAGAADSLDDGVRLAQSSIRSGSARVALDRLISVSNADGPAEAG